MHIVGFVHLQYHDNYFGCKKSNAHHQLLLQKRKKKKKKRRHTNDDETKGGFDEPKILFWLPHAWLSPACDEKNEFENWYFRETTFGCENRK